MICIGHKNNINPDADLQFTSYVSAVLLISDGGGKPSCFCPNLFHRFGSVCIFASKKTIYPEIPLTWHKQNQALV